MPRASRDHIAEGGGLAEEVISTVRTAQAFGTQSTLTQLYSLFVQKSLRLDLSTAAVNAIAFGICFFAIYSAYGFGESIDVEWIWLFK